MARAKTNTNGKGNGAQNQNKRPVSAGRGGAKVVKSTGAQQRPKLGAKNNQVKPRAVVVSAGRVNTSAKQNNKPIIKKQAPKANNTSVNKSQPRQKLVLQEPKNKPAPKPTARVVPKQNTKQNAQQNVQRPNSAASVGRPKQAAATNNASRNNEFSGNSGSANSSELARALQTANSIAITRSHPKQAEVVELLRTHEKGWVDDRKFITLLKSLAF